MVLPVDRSQFMSHAHQAQCAQKVHFGKIVTMVNTLLDNFIKALKVGMYVLHKC